MCDDLLHVRARICPIVGIASEIDETGGGDRVNRVLARAGVASRRGADALVAAGRVTVDGAVAVAGTRVAPGQVVRVDGRPVEAEGLVYLLLHKPTGVVTTMHDPEGRPTVASLVPARPRVVPVGRLDLMTSGVLVLTNDGDLAHRLMHPSGEVEKAYRATVRGAIPDEALQRLADGVLLEDGPTLPARVALIRRGPRESVIEVVLREGRNRQVRRMCDAVGHPCGALARVRYGPLDLHGLAPGAVRRLERDELLALRAAAGDV